MRNISDWRERHNERMTNFFYPDVVYDNVDYNYVPYPKIIPYSGLPNYNVLFDYEIEDLIQKKYFYDLYKIILRNEGFYPKPNVGVGKLANKYSSFEYPFRKVNLAKEIMEQAEEKHRLQQIELKKKKAKAKEEKKYAKVDNYFKMEKLREKESVIPSKKDSIKNSSSSNSSNNKRMERLILPGIK